MPRSRADERRPTDLPVGARQGGDDHIVEPAGQFLPRTRPGNLAARCRVEIGLVVQGIVFEDGNDEKVCGKLDGR